MGDAITLDPVEVSTARTELELDTGAIRVGQEGPDWGEAAIQAYMADLERGSSPVDFRVPNRDIKIPLSLGASGPAGFKAADRALQAKVALIQREGGWLRREYPDGRALYLDLVNATLAKPDRYGHRGLETDVQLSLDAIPDFYGDEITLDLITETSATEIVSKLKQGGVDAVIQGDYPGRCRIVVTDTQGASQLALLWGFRSRYYDAAATAALAFQAEALTPLDTAATAALSGASGSGSNTIRHNNLGSGWTPVLNTNLLAGTFLTHTGTYRLWARVYSTSPAGTVKVRAVYDVGDLAFPEENTDITIPAASQFFWIDLGELRLDKVPAGTHRWQGQIQAKGDVGGENIYIDKVDLVPLAENAGKLRAPITLSQGLAASAARDEFNQAAAGALSGKTAPVGGAWTTAGDATDLAVETTGKTAERTSVALGVVGRFAVSGAAAMTAMAVQVDVKLTTASAFGCFGGVVGRYVDINNWWRVGIGAFGGSATMYAERRVAGVYLLTEDITAPIGMRPGDGAWTVAVLIDAAGRWYAWTAPAGAVLGTPVLSGQESILATGGALASGKPGFFDHKVTASAETRNYDNFAAWVPTLDAVMFASRLAELRTDGMYRKDAAGAAFGPISEVTGDLPRIPPSGAENRPVELFVKGSRGDLDQLPDGGIDDGTAQVIYRPSWLLSPGT